MPTTRAFKSGDGQAVTIPDEIAFEYGQDLTITRHGEVVTITPTAAHVSMAETIAKLRAMPKPPTVELIERTEMPERDRY